VAADRERRHQLGRIDDRQREHAVRSVAERADEDGVAGVVPVDAAGLDGVDQLVLPGLIDVGDQRVAAGQLVPRREGDVEGALDVEDDGDLLDHGQG